MCQGCIATTRASPSPSSHPQGQSLLYMQRNHHIGRANCPLFSGKQRKTTQITEVYSAARSGAGMGAASRCLRSPAADPAQWGARWGDLALLILASLLWAPPPWQHLRGDAACVRMESLLEPALGDDSCARLPASLKSGQARARAGRAGGDRGLAWCGAFLCSRPSPPWKGGSLVGFHSSVAAPAPHQPNRRQSCFFARVTLSSERLSPGQSLYIEASAGCIFGGFYCSDAGFIPGRLSPRSQRCRTSPMAAHAAEGLLVLLLRSLMTG